MKTGLLDAPSLAAPIVALSDAEGGSEALAFEEGKLARARAFAEPLLAGRRFDTGEDALQHAEGVAAILLGVGAGPAMRAAAYLVYASEYLNKPEEIIGQAFGEGEASLVAHTRKLVQIQRSARDVLADEADGPMRAEQIERVRKMLLAFSRDLRVVLLRLASRLQTLRYYAQTKTPCPKLLASESLQVFAPLANRLGIWQIKWELEDLAFRFLQPDAYRDIARSLHEKRIEREQMIEAARLRLIGELGHVGLQAEVQGRPKHIYSIWKKMKGKGLTIDRVFDVRALRVIVPSVQDCYATLSRVHEIWRSLPDEFDDYIARPKPNGYQSLHTVVVDEQDRAIEIQIRTQAMHDHAESGVAAHWAYKEAGAKGYAGVSAAGQFESRVAEARKTVLRQLLAWERDLAQAETSADEGGQGLFEDRIYVFTPQGTIIDLPRGATPVDFAYTVHTDLGHRCRGARVDGAMVPLNTPLMSGQTVEVVAAKDRQAGPSLDWLNPDLGYLQSARAKAKVRAWFNAMVQQQTIAKGRDAVEKLLQREGRTAFKLEDLAAQLGFRNAEALFEVVGKDEFSLKNIENLLRPADTPPDADELLAQRLARSESNALRDAAKNGRGIMVVGVDSLLTQLARCCKPAPPDAIGGYVTRGKGVAIHRTDCSNFRQMVGRSPERRIAVEWGEQAPRSDARETTYAVDVAVQAHDRPGLLRDLCDAFAKEKTHVVGMQTQTHRDRVDIMLTVQTADVTKLSQVLARVSSLPGVGSARRK
jgi:GTP pyrophosphokinase